MVSGLGHLHDLGIIHRDLKPQNVLISKNQSLVAQLSDMGISKCLPDDKSSVGHHTTGKCFTFAWPRYISVICDNTSLIGEHTTVLSTTTSVSGPSLNFLVFLDRWQSATRHAPERTEAGPIVGYRLPSFFEASCCPLSVPVTPRSHCRCMCYRVLVNFPASHDTARA